MDPQLSTTLSQSQSQYLHSLNLNVLTLQDDWMFPFSAACQSTSASDLSHQMAIDCNQTVESFKEWTTFPNHADSWSSQPVVDQQRSQNLLEESPSEPTVSETLEQPPKAISIPQSRSSDRMRAERWNLYPVLEQHQLTSPGSARYTPEINFPHSPVSSPSVAQSWDFSSYKPGQIKRHAAMQMMETRQSEHSFTDTSSGTSFDSTIDPHMLSYDFSSINTSFAEPIQGPLSEDPATFWRKLSSEEVNRNAEVAQKKRSFETYSEPTGSCEPWSLEYLQVMAIQKSQQQETKTSLEASNQPWIFSSAEANQAPDEPNYTFQTSPSSHGQWKTREYLMAPSPIRMPSMAIECLDDIPDFSLPEMRFPNTLARTSTVIHSPLPAVPRSLNLTSETHTYKKICHTVRSTVSPEPVPRSVPFSNTNSPTLQPASTPTTRRREPAERELTSCPQCNKQFTRLRDQRRHEKQIHEKKVAAICTLSPTNSCGCSKSFKRAEHLRSHLKTVAKRRETDEEKRRGKLSQQEAP